MARYEPIFFLHWGREGRKALPHVATLGSAGGCGQDGGRGDGGDGGDGCGGGGPWKSTVEAVVTVPSGPRPCSDRLGLTQDESPREHVRRKPASARVAHQTDFASKAKQKVGMGYRPLGGAISPSIDK